jgi:O-antigen/teichoic acid export membrane protein
LIFKKNINTILKTSFLSGGLNFLSSFLFLIYVDKIQYGLYLILLGLFAISGRVLQSIDDLIVRFQKMKENINHKEFFFTAFFIKIIIFILISFLCLTILYLFPGLIINSQNNISKLFICSILFLCFLNSTKTFLISLMYSNLLYNFIFRINLLTSIIFFFLTLILITYLGANILYFIYMNIILGLLQITFYGNLCFKIISKFRKARKIIHKKYFLFFYKKYCKNFALPLSGNYFLAYFNKDHGANLLLGAAFGPEIVSVIAIAKNLYEYVHNFINNFIIKLYPIYLHYSGIKKTPNIFLKKIFYSGNLIYLAIFFFMIFFKDFYFSLMNLNNTKLHSIIFIIVSFDFVIKFLPAYLTHATNLSRSTNSILISNLFKTFFVSVFFLIGIYYQNILICLIGYIAGYLSTVPYLYKSCPFDFKFKEINYLFILQICIILILVYFILMITK